MYSAMLLEHFENPRNAGSIANASAGARVENPACGDVIELSLRVENHRIAEARFLAKGCVSSVACGSALTEILRGMSVEDALKVSREDLVAYLGGVPEASRHAAALAIDAVRQALRFAGTNESPTPS